jgi:hypothetical protein
MKVKITVIRRTEYTSIVDMTEEKFTDLHERINSRGDTRRNAEQEANRLIDVSDWQDDTLHSLDEFEAFEDALHAVER